MIRPETVALLDRMFGHERSVDDALTRIENAANELYLMLDHLEQMMRRADGERVQLLTDLELTDEQRELVKDHQTYAVDLTKEAQWSESNRESEVRTIETAADEIAKLAEGWK